MSEEVSNIRPKPDKLLVDLADYAANYMPTSQEALDTARFNLSTPLAAACSRCATRNASSILAPSFLVRH
jgi:hypothetical protein